jgi:hypothetical protein
MIFRPFYHFETGCAAYLFGCGGLGKCAVVDVPPKPAGMQHILELNQGRVGVRS